MRHNEIAMTRELAIIQCRQVSYHEETVLVGPSTSPPVSNALQPRLCESNFVQHEVVKHQTSTMYRTINAVLQLLP